jgi:hypothetical protein
MGGLVMSEMSLENFISHLPESHRARLEHFKLVTIYEKYDKLLEEGVIREKMLQEALRNLLNVEKKLDERMAKKV